MYLSILSGVLAGCNSSNTNIANDGKVIFEEKFDSLILKNDKISLSFMKDNGSLFSIKNIIKGTDYIDGSVGGNWAMMVDISTDDPFLSNPTGSNTYLVSSRKQTMSYLKDDVEDGIKLTFTYDISDTKVNNIRVIQTITLLDKDDKASFSYHIQNNMDNSVIVSFTGAQISGIKEGKEDYTLFWPYNEGKLYEQSVNMVKTSTDEKARMNMCYPVPSSLQLLQLYNSNESLFYYVKDATREYKEFNFGAFINSKQYDYQGVTAIDKVSMSCTQYPFITTNEEKDVHEVIIGTSNYGDYYTGSNYYREFLVNNMSRRHSHYVKNWTGFSCLIGSKYGNKHFASYTQTPGFDTYYASWANMTNKYGVYGTSLLGWHEGGFDSNYPDYEVIEGTGFGEENLRTAFTQAHNDDNQLYPYINLHIADIASKWSNTICDSTKGLLNIQSAAIKYKGFNNSLPASNYYDYMQLESYGTATTYYAMCPKSELFINAIIDACTRLRNLGADGFWFDQLMQMSANLCFDKSHGHKTPATAMGEGYKQLFEELELVMKASGNQDYVLSCEGVCDAYIEYIDVCGYLWSRKLGARDTTGDGHNMSPEITRYTMPSKFLGLEGAGTTSGSDDEFARAFVMCDPFLADPYKPSVGVWTSIYNSDSTYLNGRYVDKLGSSCTNDEIIYGITISEDNSKLVINAYNYSLEESDNDTITLDLNRLNIQKQIKSIIDMRIGNKVNFDKNVITLPHMDVNGVISLLVELK